MSCEHKVIEVLAQAAPRLRCTHCHLTLKREELSGDYCPECLEGTGKRHSDFEPVAAQDSAPRYRCDSCGMIIVGGSV